MVSKDSTVTVPMARAQMTKAIFLYGIETPKKKPPEGGCDKTMGI
jgi:hypothetical protein